MSLLTWWCVWMLLLLALERWTAGKARAEAEKVRPTRRRVERVCLPPELEALELDIQEGADGWVRASHPDYPMYMGIGQTANQAALSLLCRMERGEG